MTPRRATETTLWTATIVSTLVLFALRAHVAVGTGFGDSEALYASYALFPQPAYLDHPGLIGSIARLIGRGAAPTPLSTHLLPACLAAAVPWVGALASLAAGARLRGALAVAVGAAGERSAIEKRPVELRELGL